MARYDSISLAKRQDLLSALEIDGPVAIHRVLNPFSDKHIPRQVTTQPPRRMTEYYNKNLTSLTLEEIEAHAEDAIKLYEVTSEQRDIIEEVTRTQSKSVKWYYSREGRVTASKSFEVSRTNLEKPAKSLVQSIVYPMDSNFHSAATE